MSARPVRSLMKSRNAVLAAVAAAGLATAGWGVTRAENAPATPSAVPEKGLQQAFSRPSDERNLKYAAPGLVAETMVEEGAHVTKGQLLAKQDDRQGQAALHSLKVEADSTAEIDYSKADKADKEVKLKRKQELYANGRLASESEVEEAALAVQLAEAQIKVSEVKHDKAVADAEQQQIKVDQMQLTSPIDGIVETINAHGGEMADPQAKDGAVVIVSNDPLWVEMDLPVAAANKLKVDQQLEVGYWNPGPNGTGTVTDWQQAKISYFDPKASASGGTERVRLVLPNAQQQRSGSEMRVRLPADVVAVSNQ